MKLFGLSFFDKIQPMLDKAAKYFEAGNLEGAERELKEVLKLDPENSAAREKLKEIYRERDTLRAVYALTQKAAQKNLEVDPAKEPVEKEGDRRRHPRVEDERPIHYRVIKKSEEATGLNLNISAGGMLLVVQEEVPVGTFIELKFGMPPPEHPVYAIGRVVRVEKKREGEGTVFSLGVKFTNISPEDQKRIQEHVLKTP